MNIKQYNYLIFIITVLFSAISIYLNIGILVYLSLTIILVLIFKNPYFYGVGYVWIFSFSTQYYTYANFSFARMVIIFTIIILLAKKISNLELKIKNLKIFYLLIVILTYSFISIFWSFDSYLALMDYLTLAINILFIIILINFQDENQFNIVKNNLIFYTITSLALTILMIMLNSTFTDFISGDVFRLSIDSEQNVGEFGRNLVIYFGIFIYFAKFNANRLLKYFIIVIFLLLIFLSGSRTSAVGALIIFCSFIIFRANLRSFINIKNISIVILMLVFVIILINFMDVDYILNRFTLQNILDSNGSRRFIIWDYYLSIIKYNPLFGVGVGGNSEILALSYYTSATEIYLKPAHNLYIELIIQFGFIGTIFFILYFYFIFYYSLKEYIRYKKKSSGLIFLYLVLMIMAIGEPMFYSKLFWIINYLIISNEVYKKESII